MTRMVVVVSPDVEACTVALAADLYGPGRASWATKLLADPMAPIPLVIAQSRAETWFRRRLAQETGIAAAFRWLTLDAAMDALVAAATASSPPAPAPAKRWFDHASDDAFAASHVAGCLVTLWSSQWSAPWLAPVRAYVDPASAGPEALGNWRGVSLAQQAAERLLEMCRARPQRVVAWARAPDTAPHENEHVEPWIAHSLAGLGFDAAGPAWARAQVLSRTVSPAHLGPLLVLGVPAMRSADRELLTALASSTTVRWYRPALQPARWAIETAPPLPSETLSLSFQHLDETERVELAGTATIEVRAPVMRDGAPSWMLSVWQAALRGEPPPARAETEKSRTRLCGAWTPSREVEALRDTLLEHFNEGRLEPRDVFVMTPDIGTYGPLIEAIFARRGGASGKTAEAEAEADADTDTDAQNPNEGRGASKGAPAIPVSITQLGLQSENELAAVLLQLIDQCADRLTLPGLANLLSAPAFQRGMGLNPADAEDVTGLLNEAGARWGFDSADREAVYGVPVAQNTIDFGLQRMALGAVMPDEAPEAEFGYGEDAREPLSPVESGDRERIRRSARAAEVVRRIGALRDTLRGGPRTPDAWKALIDDTITAFTPTGSALAWMHAQLVETLNEALPSTSVPVTLDALRQLLRSRFSLPVPGRGNNNNAVQVAPLTSGAIFPCGFVALLGMNTGAFPRPDRPLSWEPAAEVCGVRLAPSAESRDRQALAHAILAATDDIWVSFVSHEPKRGATMPPCVPVEELIEFAERAGAARAHIVTEEPRHPWSPARWDGAVFFDASVVAAARALSATPTDAPVIEAGNERLPEKTLPTELAFGTLANGLENGPKLFLHGRLGVYLDEPPAPLADREPVELSVLMKRSLENGALQQLLALGALRTDPPAKDELETLVANQLRKLAARGELPLRAGGELIVRNAVEAALATIETAREKVLAHATLLSDAPPLISLEVPFGEAATCASDDLRVRLFGRAQLTMGQPGTGAGILSVSVSVSSISAKRWLGSWLPLVATSAAGAPAAAAGMAIVTQGNVEWGFCAQSPAQDLETLRTLCRVWRLGREQPLPLFPKCSKAMVEKISKIPAGGSPEALQDAALKGVMAGWKPYVGRGDSDDPYIQRLFPGWRPEDALVGFFDTLDDCVQRGGPISFRALAEAVWGPIVRGRRPDATGRGRFKYAITANGSAK